MSYRSLCRQTCYVLRLNQGSEDGSPVTNYEALTYDPGHSKAGQPKVFKVFLDLGFIRAGKDPRWTPEAGRPADRSGVLFGLPDFDGKAGDRVKMLTGPPGTFLIEGALDDAWTPSAKHHIEFGVVEVASQVARAQYTQAD